MLCIIVAVIVSVVISLGISNGLKEVQDVMKLAEAGQLNISAPVRGQNEVGVLAASLIVWYQILLHWLVTFSRRIIRF